MATSLSLGGQTFASTDKACVNKTVRRDLLRMVIRSAVANGPTWETQFEIRPHPNEHNATLNRALRDSYGVAVTCRFVDGPTTGGPPRFSLVGRTETKRSAFACRLAPATTSTPLQIASGNPASGLNSGFYDAKDDCALHLGAQRVAIGASQPDPIGRSFPIRLDFDSQCSFDFTENLYQTIHGFDKFATIRRDWPPRPIAGWLDWYIAYGKNSEDLVLRNLNWLADHLRDFGLEVIQIDDGWQGHCPERLPGDLQGKEGTDWLHPNENFPHGMAWLAERIHEKGFLAGIWLVPYATNNAVLLREHPDWFLKDTNGNLKTAQGTWARQFGNVLDLSYFPVHLHYLAPLFKTLSNKWDYDYFKLDATGWTLLGIKDGTYPNRSLVTQKLGKKTLAGTEVVREGLETVRRIVNDKFVLACHAPCPEVVGLVDGARVAGDMSPGWEKGPLYMLRQTMDSFYTHGICWLNDPDCLVLKPLTVEQARVFASMFGLTAQHLMLSDPMDELGKDKTEILRRVLPICATRPLDLYPRKDAATIWDLKLERPFGSWDVVGVFNIEKQPARRVVRFAELGLANEVAYIVYDYWNRRCLGRFEREVILDVPPTACRVLAIHAESGRPQVISTSRHITQGGVDLAKVEWNAKRKELSGRSHVVRNDPYELRLWVPEGFRPIAVESSNHQAKLEITDESKVAVVRLASQQTDEIRWLVRFEK